VNRTRDEKTLGHEQTGDKTHFKEAGKTKTKVAFPHGVRKPNPTGLSKKKAWKVESFKIKKNGSRKRTLPPNTLAESGQKRFIVEKE
ncbi:MAG: hypothetical protein AABY11_02910, partial [archaeon]